MSTLFGTGFFFRALLHIRHIPSSPPVFFWEMFKWYVTFEGVIHMMIRNLFFWGVYISKPFEKPHSYDSQNLSIKYNTYLIHFCRTRLKIGLAQFGLLWISRGLACGKGVIGRKKTSEVCNKKLNCWYSCKEWNWFVVGTWSTIHF